MNLGEMRCPQCGRIGPTIPGKCTCGYDPANATIPKYRIYKYGLTGMAQQVLELPKHSVLLRTAVVQNGNICLYARVNPLVKETSKLEVGIVGTGWEIPDLPVYNIENHLCTVTDDGYVWHIFARPC